MKIVKGVVVILEGFSYVLFISSVPSLLYYRTPSSSASDQLGLNRIVSFDRPWAIFWAKVCLWILL